MALEQFDILKGVPFQFIVTCNQQTQGRGKNHCKIANQCLVCSWKYKWQTWMYMYAWSKCNTMGRQDYMNLKLKIYIKKKVHYAACMIWFGLVVSLLWKRGRIEPSSDKCRYRWRWLAWESYKWLAHLHIHTFTTYEFLFAIQENRFVL